MSTAITSLASNGALEQAYREFLDGLPVRNPRKLLFINIPQVPAELFSSQTAKLNGYHIYPPIGYLYVVAAARQVNPDVEVSILDLNYEMLRRCHLDTLGDGVHDFWKELIAEEIAASGQSHVCVGNMFEATTRVFLRILEYIRTSFPKVTLVAGGVQVTQDYREIIEGDYCHVAFRNESEMQFKTFLESCAGNEPLPIPAAIAFKHQGKVFETQSCPEPITEFLDIRPYYDLIRDVENYYKYGGVNPFSRYVGKGKPFGTVLSNRGCRAHCTFCAVESFNGVGVRRRSARSVVDEIKFLVEKKGIKVIEWLDDDLLLGRTKSAELFKLMAEELPAGLEWIANNGVIAGAVTEEIMYWMVKSGCKAFKVGIESGNEAMLRKIKKPGTKQVIRKAGEIFKKYPEVFVSGNFIVGFPQETFGEMLDTYNFSEELAWDWANYYICQPLPGTDMFDGFQAMGDDRCGKDDYGAYNPGKSSQQKGNFGYLKGYHSDDEKSRSILSGRNVFKIPKDQVPSAEQIKEIWFSFNMMANFLNNRNFKPGGNPAKIVRWFESIHASYPRDAGMAATLAHVYRMLGNRERSGFYGDKFHALVDEFDYWKRRVEEFPELLDYAG